MSQREGAAYHFSALFIMHPFEEERVSARKRLLNRFDITSFDKVPNFIVNSFFGKYSYHKQLIIRPLKML